MTDKIVTVQARVRLDWSDPGHWSPTAAGCSRCHGLTHARDERGRAVHQSCAEEELAVEMAGQLTGRIVGTAGGPGGDPEEQRQSPFLPA